MTSPAVLPLIETQFLPNAVGILYTAESGQPNMMVQFNGLIIANIDSVQHSFTLYKVPSGGAPAAGNTIFGTIVLPKFTTMVAAEQEGVFILSPGATLRGFADVANMVTITAHGVKYQ